MLMRDNEHINYHKRMKGKVLILTNMYPSLKKKWLGTFVRDQVKTLRGMGSYHIKLFLIKGKQSGGSNLDYLKGYFRLLTLLKKNDYDIIHSHHLFTTILYKLTFHNTPIVYTIHEGEFFKTNIVKRFLFRACARRADFVFFVNFKAYQYMNLKNSMFLPCGVDTKVFNVIDSRESLRKELNLKASKFYIFFPADPERPEKNAKFVYKFIDVYRAWLLRENIKFVFGGHIKHYEMPIWMNATDLLISFSNYESDGMVFKEAMACNLPIISFDIGNARRYFGSDEGCGSIISPEFEQFREKILYWKNKGRSAGRKQLLQFGLDIGTVSKNISDVYCGMMKSKNTF